MTLLALPLLIDMPSFASKVFIKVTRSALHHDLAGRKSTNTLCDDDNPISHTNNIAAKEGEGNTKGGRNIHTKRDEMISISSRARFALVLALFREMQCVQQTREQQQSHQTLQNNGRGRRLQSDTFRDSDDPKPSNGFEDGFVEDCSNFLLSKQVLGDQKISKTEYADFLAGYCVDHSTCQEGDDVSFASLNTNLQTEFIFASCPFHQASSANCFEDFKAMGEDFGIMASPDTLASVDEKIAALCNTTFFIINQEGLMDEQSVLAPRPIPTPSPKPTEPPNPLPYDAISTLTPSFNPTLNETDKIAPGFSEFQSEGRRLTTAALLGIISALSAVAFCVAVVWSGGWKEPEYDMNQVDPFPVKPKSKSRRRLKAPVPSGEDTFHDEGDDPHLGRQLSSDNVIAGRDSPMGNGHSPVRVLKGNGFRPPNPSLPPFHPANIETESGKAPKVAASLNPMNLLTPGSHKVWQPTKPGTSSKYGGNSDYLV